ncbi:hypothetical protein M758_3G007200 [Ceratodon purpureus]|nr:hypothetical protein M758_3G007200 [Ceratodon purpureus]
MGCEQNGFGNCQGRVFTRWALSGSGIRLENIPEAMNQRGFASTTCAGVCSEGVLCRLSREGDMGFRHREPVMLQFVERERR